MKRFLIHFGTNKQGKQINKYFVTLYSAKDAAKKYFQRTGIVCAITEITPAK